MTGSHSSLPEIPPAAHEENEERRSAPRFSLLIQAAKLLAGQKEYPCIVRNASSEGLNIRFYGNLPETNDLTIELANGERFDVGIVWREKEVVGLRFINAEDLTRITSLSGKALPRRPLRVDVSAEASVSWEGNSFPVTLTNLSQQGARIECESRLAIFQFVRLDIEDLEPIYAKIRWRRGGEYGLVFETTLTFEQLAEAAAHLNALD